MIFWERISRGVEFVREELSRSRDSRESSERPKWRDQLFPIESMTIQSEETADEAEKRREQRLLERVGASMQAWHGYSGPGTPQTAKNRCVKIIRRTPAPIQQNLIILKLLSDVSTNIFQFHEIPIEFQQKRPKKAGRKLTEITRVGFLPTDLATFAKQ